MSICAWRHGPVADIKNRDELAREQRALMEKCDRGLGLMGDWESEVNWYRGCIQQLVHVKKTTSQYSLQLGAMQKVGRSHRLARYLGLRRVLQIKLPEKMLYNQKEMNELKDLFAYKFVLCGRVFVAFVVKDQKVYLVKTDEDFEHMADYNKGDELRFSLEDLVK